MAYIDVSGLAGISLLAGIDPVTREMFLSLATVDASINPIDIYKEMRICRRLDETLRGFEVFLAAFGNVAKGGGKFTERYVQQLLGTRFVPYDANQELTVTGTVITDDGQEGVACFDRTGLTATTVVDINYIPPQVEIITVTTGSGLSVEQDAKLTSIDANTTYQNKIVNNLKELKKISTSWYLVIYDDGEVSGGVEILRKKMADKDGNDIADLTASILAAELENSV